MTTTTIKTSGRYVAAVRCGEYHSGNHRLAVARGGYAECCGCGRIYTAESVCDAQAEAEAGRLKGVIGSGWLIPV